MSNWKKIFTKSSSAIKKEDLLNYISGTANAETVHEIEEEMIDSPMLNDAVEGLQIAGNKSKIEQSVQSINQQLQKQLQKKQVKKSVSLSQQHLVYLTLIIILSLAIVGYIFIRILQ